MDEGTTGPIWRVFQSFLMGCPAFVVWLLGGIIALATLNRHRGVSLLVLLGVAILALESIASMIGHEVLSAMANRGDMDWEVARPMHSGLSCVGSVVFAIGFLLILAAAFRWRNEPSGLSSSPPAPPVSTPPPPPNAPYAPPAGPPGF